MRAALNDKDNEIDEIMSKKKRRDEALVKRQRRRTTPKTQDRTYHWGPGRLTWKLASLSWQATRPRCH
eukprot:12906401-Prorocentrum_lima.AAC.1